MTRLSKSPRMFIELPFIFLIIAAWVVALFLLGYYYAIAKALVKIAEKLDETNKSLNDQMQRWQNLAVRRAGYAPVFPEAEPPQRLEAQDSREIITSEPSSTIIGTMRPPFAQAEYDYAQEEEKRSLNVASINQSFANVPPLTDEEKERLKALAAQNGNQ